MKKLLLSLVFISSLHYLQAQIFYEDFEGGTADIAWVGLNGVYNGVVDNPAPDAVNSSAFVGSYTNDAGFDFCFALGTMGGPADLTKFNLVKMKVWSPIAPIQVLFKFEGGGSQVEMFRDITVPNQWVEYSFDLSAGATFTTMDKVLVSFNPFVLGSTETFYFDDIVGYEATQDLETFENGAALHWTGINGFFNGVVTNPDPNSVNASDSVGYFVKDTHDFSFVITELGTPLDLSILNQFTLQVRAQAPTQLLLKLEGAGPPIERFANIGLANEWQEYKFDFSDAADATHLNKIVLFFDPFVKTSVDTYYFDNLRAIAEGPCKTVTPDPFIIDDFECNRNATYVNGWDSLTVVNNPAPNAVNASARVGQYIDPLGEQWAALLMDYQNPVDLSTRNQLNVKIWSPKVVPILFKLEGGSSAAKEIWMNVPAAGEWINYAIDFSSEALSSHRKIVLFFNAGQDPEAGDIYYIDDISWKEKTDVAIEDFESGAPYLPWGPLDKQTLLHGTFAVIDNPDQSGINTSVYVGEYTKGTSAFSTLAAVAPGIIDISVKPQYNLDVWSVNPGTISFQLESVSQGNKEVTRDITAGADWETVSFDFTDYQGITDWASMRLIFNPTVAEGGAIFYFDNLTQSQRTVDPCEGTVPVGNLVDDFECQRNHDVLNGGEHLSVVGNPLITVQNSSTLVGQYADQPNEPWAALCYNFIGSDDLDVFNQFSFQILAEEAVPILMKLEGGTSPASEIWTSVTTPGVWETLTVDFSAQAGEHHTKACIFFNAGVTTTTIDEYYLDNVKFAHAPFTGCLINFDDAAFISDSWRFFPADNSGEFELVDNPDPSGINTSAKVGKAIEKSTGGQPWQGMYTDLPADIVFGSDKIVKMKIWSPQVASVTMKIENSQSTPPGPGSGDLTVANTKANEWEELSFDFATTPITDNGRYIRVTLIWDINNIPSEDVTYYFDDIQLTAGECATSSIGGGPQRPGDLTIAPNPVMDELRIDELGRVARLDIYNLYGQRLSSIWTGAAASAYLDVSALYQGAYILSGYTDKGELIAISRFVKL